MSVKAKRDELATAYTAAGLPANVHGSPPTAVQPPALVLVPGDPYLDPDRIGPITTLLLQLRVTVVTSRGDTLSELAELEQLAVDAMQATPAGWTVSALSRPSRVPLDPDQQRNGLSAYFTVSTPHTIS